MMSKGLVLFPDTVYSKIHQQLLCVTSSNH